MSDAQPKAWRCKQCGERVDPTMELCWHCGHGRSGKPDEIIQEADAKPFKRCPQCEYDLRGNPDADHCPECGSSLTIRGAEKHLYSLPATDKTKAALSIFRHPLRLAPFLFMAWLANAVLFIGYQERSIFESYFRPSSVLDYVRVLLFYGTVLLTLFMFGALIVQGTEPPRMKMFFSMFQNPGATCYDFLGMVPGGTSSGLLCLRCCFLICYLYNRRRFGRRCHPLLKRKPF